MVLLAAFTTGILAIAQEMPEGHAKGYVVVLKNKQRIRAREPMKIVGKQAFITLITGTMTAIPLDMVDIIATERYNKLGHRLHQRGGQPRPRCLHDAHADPHAGDQAPHDPLPQRAGRQGFQTDLRFQPPLPLQDEHRDTAGLLLRPGHHRFRA